MAKLAKKKSKKTPVAKKAPTKTPKKTAKKSVAGKRTAPKKAAKKAVAAKRTAPKKSAKRKTAPKKKPTPAQLRKSTPAKKAARAASPQTKAAPPAPKKRKLLTRGHVGEGRMDGGRAFLPDLSDGRSRRVKDDLAEELGEEFVAAATSGEATDDARDAMVPEEEGGPFITTSAESQYAAGTDASNPDGAEREPFPLTHGTPR